MPATCVAGAPNPGMATSVVPPRTTAPALHTHEYKWVSPRPRGVGAMTRLRAASLNMSGAAEPGVWARFTHRMKQWAEREGIHVVLGQEHNLPPSEGESARRIAIARGFHLVMSHAEKGEDGTHRGGTFVLINMNTTEWPDTREKQENMVVHSEPGATVVKLGWHGREITVGSIYAPCKPTPRLYFLQNMRSWVKPNMFLGGDWNCVPDVTLDVQSKDPLRSKT